MAGGRKKNRFDLVGKRGSFDRGWAHHEVFGSTEDHHGTLNLCGIGQGWRNERSSSGGSLSIVSGTPNKFIPNTAAPLMRDSTLL